MVNHARKSGYIFEYRLTLLGAEKTGKTSILDRFMNDTFTHRYRPTIEDHRTHVIDHLGNMCVCLFNDTAGCNDFPAMKRLAIQKGNAFIIVYSIEDKKSFAEAKRIVKEVKHIKSSDLDELKIILIGNKTDLQEKRVVDFIEGETVVTGLNEENITSDFFEVSAKENKNIDLAFISLLDMFMPKPETVEVESPTHFEKVSFRRLSIKRKKKKQIHREEEQVRLGVRKSLCVSDSDLFEHTIESLTQDQNNKAANTDSDGENSDHETLSPIHRDRGGSTTIEVLRMKFGSIQKLFKPSEGSPKVKRSSNAGII